jgi:hypothetical protein
MVNIHRPVLSSKYFVSETGFRLRLQVEPPKVNPIVNLVSISVFVSLCFWRCCQCPE